MNAAQRLALFHEHRDVLISAARRYSAEAYATTGYGVLVLFRKANSHVRAARELNRQLVSWLKTQHGTQRDLF